MAMEALQLLHLRSPFNHPKSSRVVPLPPQCSPLFPHPLTCSIACPKPLLLCSPSSSSQVCHATSGSQSSLETSTHTIEWTLQGQAVKEVRTVNKVETAMRIVHIPTGIAVRCTVAEEGSQLANRIRALSRLKAKLLVIAEEQRASKIIQIRGDAVKAEWGQQIRNYVFHPYKLVKDVRTGLETSDITSVMDGELDSFVKSYLKFKYTSSATASSN